MRRPAQSASARELVAIEIVLRYSDLWLECAARNRSPDEQVRQDAVLKSISQAAFDVVHGSLAIPDAVAVVEKLAGELHMPAATSSA